MHLIYVENKIIPMEGGVKALLDCLAKYTGKSAPLLLARELKKAGVEDPLTASEMERMSLIDSITRDVLAPVLSRGRLPIARSELMAVLNVSVGAAGIPVTVDGVRVLPEKIKEEAAKHFKDMSEFILAEEMRKYGVEAMSAADSRTRVRVVEGFVERHFGPSGKSIVDARMDELGLGDILHAPVYNRLLLLEFIIQDMLLFYVEPLKARMLRSELVTILDVDLELVQGPSPEYSKAEREVKSTRQKPGYTAAAKTDFEDLLIYTLKKNASEMRIRDLQSAPPKEKTELASSAVAEMLGGMTDYVFSRLQTDEPGIRLKFILQYMRNYLKELMPPEEADSICVRLTGYLNLPVDE